MGKLLRWLLSYLAKKEVKERQYAVGITSYVSKGGNESLDEHIVCLDYDTSNFGFVFNDCNELSKFFNLSDFEMYRTKKGFHVFFWSEKIPFSRLKMIINYSRCDIMYKKISNYFNYKTIRASGKYIVPDVSFVGRFAGNRIATKDERELGNLKRNEYLTLQKQKFFTDEVLKDGNISRADNVGACEKEGKKPEASP